MKNMNNSSHAPNPRAFRQVHQIGIQPLRVVGRQPG
jgi:hypothetical protein